jgi:CBS domain-containing protein
MYVEDILKRKGRVVYSSVASERVADAVKKLHKNDVGALVVQDGDGGIAGIISERDIVRGLAEKGNAVFQCSVGDLMTRRVYVCKPRDYVKDVMGWMTNYRVRHLPVVDGDRILGVVSIGDVVRHRLDEVQTEANVLRDIVIASQ